MAIKDIIEHAPAWITLLWMVLSVFIGWLVREYTRTRDHERRIKAIEEAMMDAAEREVRKTEREELVREVMHQLGRLNRTIEDKSL